MQEEKEEIQEQQQEGQMDANSYLQNIKELRENMVDKASYDKLKKENEILSKAALNRGFMEEDEKSPEEISKANQERMKELRKELYSDPDKQMSNLEFVTKTLELRDLVIEEEGYDPFTNPNVSASDYLYEEEGAKKTAQFFKELVDSSDGDPRVFNAKLEGYVKDDKPTKPNKNIRR